MSINLAEPAAVAATSRRTVSLTPLGITALLVGALGAFAVAPTTASTNAWGVLQRTMFLVSILWFAREAWRAEPVE